jgi:hypothetical protein
MSQLVLLFAITAKTIKAVKKIGADKKVNIKDVPDIIGFVIDLAPMVRELDTEALRKELHALNLENIKEALEQLK